MKLDTLKAVLAATAAVTFASVAEAAVIFHVEFEAPAYSLGPVHGQDGWSAQFGPVNHVNSAVVHGGAQSLNTIAASRPFDGGILLPIGGPQLWYLETWAYIQPFEHFGTYEARFSASGVLGSAFYIAMRGDGLLTLNTGTAFSQRTLGANGLNKGSSSESRRPSQGRFRCPSRVTA